MSEWRERYDESPGLARTFEWLESYYQYLVGAVLVLFMLYVRFRTWTNFTVDGRILYSGNDPWYHLRTTTYSVEHWPATMPFDPWTYFPYGNASGQFGTFFDQIIATIAFVVGLGSPSEQLIALIVLLVPPLFGVLIAVPTYLMGRRVGGRFGGVAALIVLALSAGRLLSISLVGFSDHHVAEAFFQAVGVLGALTAITVAQRDKPIYEQFVERSIAPIRSTVAWSVLGGFAVTTYLWVWPPGVLLLGVIGVYFLLQLSIEFLRGESPEHTAIAGAIMMGTTAVTVTAGLDVLAISSTEFSLLQPLMALVIAVGCAFMAWLARVWERRERARWQYPLVVLVLIVAGIVAIRIATPGTFDFFVNNLLRVVGFTTSPTAGTVGEASPIPFSNADVLFEWHGFAILVAAVASLFIVGRTLIGRTVRSELLLLVVWFVLMTAATFTQSRFDYYLVVPTAVLTGYAVGVVFQQFDLQFDADAFELYKVLAVVAVVLVLVLPMVIPTTTALAKSEFNGPGNDIRGWSESLDWVEDNTPEEGRYADETAELEYYGTYARTDDFDYEAGAYGVLSWWDYGHWITVLGERIPTANPHQQGTDAAANFLLATDESQAQDVMAGLAEDDAETRYVMVDWKMVHTNTNLEPQTRQPEVNGKYFAPFEFYDAGTISRSSYYNSLFTTRYGGQLRMITYRSQNYYESMATRLYHYHGSAVDAQPVVLDWSFQNVGGNQLPMTTPGGDGGVEFYPNMTAARAAVANDSTAQVGGVGGYPTEDVSALEHYRYVGSSEMKASAGAFYRYSEVLTAIGTGLNASVIGPGQSCSSDVSLRLRGGRTVCVPSQTVDFLYPTSQQWTKVFERVPGATVEGTGPANAEVTATVEMRNDVSGETFTYRQHATTDDQGEFTMTLPYSTTGYDQWGPSEGRTNVSVRATSPYEFSVTTAGDDSTTWSATADVPEGAVIGETDETVTVELEETTGDGGDGAGGDGDGGTSDTSNRLDPPNTLLP